MSGSRRLGAHYWVIDGELAGRAGPACVPWNLFDLRDDGIDAVVSLDDDVDERELAAAEIRHFPLYQPMVLLDSEKDQRAFLSNVMPPAVRFIDDCRAEGMGVMVHCHYGCDRTGAVLACYLVAREGMKAWEAYEHIRRVNPHSFGASGYAESILTFARMLEENPGWFESPE